MAVALVPAICGLLLATAAPDAQARSTPSRRAPALVVAKHGVRGSSLPVTRLIVRYRTGARRLATESVLGGASISGHGLRPGTPIGGGTTTVLLDRALSAVEATQVAEQLAADPRVVFAEPDFPVYADGIGTASVTAAAAPLPNDPSLGSQWPLVGSYGIGAAAAWTATKGSGSVVAVLDTGITAHPDLAGQFLQGADTVDVSISNDGDGRDMDPSDPGDWYTDPTNGPQPSSWHGTHVSGTIAAVTDNGLGIAGVAPEAKLEMVRVLGSGGGYESDVEAGIYWAAGIPVSGLTTNANPASVINISLGGTHACLASTQAAIDAAVAAGTVVVVAAGNDAASATMDSPADCNHVVVVAATGQTGAPAYYSNYGSPVDLAAPGGSMHFAGDPGGVLSTLNDGATVPGNPSYAYYQGTSMATPHVAGAAALLLALHPGLTPAQVEQVLKSTARKLSQCPLVSCGAGLLDADALVHATVPVAPTGVTVGRLNAAVKPVWSAAANGGLGVTGYTATAYDAGVGGTAAGSCATTALTCTISGLGNGATYWVDVLATNVLGDGPASAPRVAAQPRVDPVVRLSGTDRFATSAAISAAAFAPGVSTVYVATGTSFPDALSGAPAAAAAGGPVLLVTPTSIPAVIATELDRLAPAHIVVLGGTGAVSASVASSLAGYAPSVTRLFGPDRYATSAAISAASFAPAVDTVYVATGTTFPDALSGAAVAGHGAGPVLLVTPTSIPSLIVIELTRLAPAHIVVLGGTGAVSAAVAAALQPYSGDSIVTRLSGPDRYATSAAISAASFPTATTVYVATGTSFPDALSGAAVAGALGSPVLLVQPTTVPASIAAELTRLSPAHIVLLGGTGAVSAAVASALGAFVP